MPEPVCANCGSRRVQPLLDSVGCEVCGAATNYDSELVHEATSKVDTGRVRGPGGEGALPPTPSTLAGEPTGITTTENYLEGDQPEEEDPEEADEPESDGYDDMSKDELYELAQEADVEGRSSMTKDQLIEALRG